MEKSKYKTQHTMEIQDLEAEAEELERQEAELLKKLTVTQERENRVFDDLKRALEESSISHKIRPETIKLEKVGSRTGRASALSMGKSTSIKETPVH